MSETFTNSLNQFKNRGLALLIDDSPQQTRSVLVAAASTIDSSRVTEILNLSGGLVSVAISPRRAESLLLSAMGRPRMSSQQEVFTDKRFCLSVEAREGVTTGISAADRAATIKILGEDYPHPRQLVSPGHVFPFVVAEGGVLVRTALPEGALDIVTIAGYSDAAVVVDLLDQAGEFANRSHTQHLSQEHNIPLITLADLVRYRLSTEKLVMRVAEAKLPTRFAGEMRSIVYRSKLHHGEHVALVKGDISPEENTLIRVQLEFTFGDVFGGSNPPTRRQIEHSLRAIGARGNGILLYLRRPRAGQISSQISSWRNSFHQKPASMMREYGLGAQILRDLGARQIELLTDSPKEFSGIENFDIKIVAQHAIPYPH